MTAAVTKSVRRCSFVVRRLDDLSRIEREPGSSQPSSSHVTMRRHADRQSEDSVGLLLMRTLLLILASSIALGQDYSLGPDSQPHAGVPKGKVTKHTWNVSRVFPGTTRDYWVY